MVLHMPSLGKLSARNEEVDTTNLCSSVAFCPAGPVSGNTPYTDKARFPLCEPTAIHIREFASYTGRLCQVISVRFNMMMMQIK
jgi:hypothetical protein